MPPKPKIKYRAVLGGAREMCPTRLRMAEDLAWTEETQDAFLDAGGTRADWQRDVRLGSIPRAVREDILEEVCRYCRGTSEEVDHYIPTSRGGTHDRSNLVGACYLCNREKSDLFVDEWEDRRGERGRSWPPRDTYMIRIRLVGRVRDEIEDAIESGRLSTTGKLPIEFLEVIWRFERLIYEGLDVRDEAKTEMASWLRGEMSKERAEEIRRGKNVGRRAA